jgi:hypothetical protein
MVTSNIWNINVFEKLTVKCTEKVSHFFYLYSPNYSCFLGFMLLLHLEEWDILQRLKGDYNSINIFLKHKWTNILKHKCSEKFYACLKRIQ